MTTSKKIKKALSYIGMREAEFAHKTGTTPSAFNQRMKTDKFTSPEIKKS